MKNVKLYAGMDVSGLRYRGNDNAVLSVEECDEDNGGFRFKVGCKIKGGYEHITYHREDGTWAFSGRECEFDIIYKVPPMKTTIEIELSKVQISLNIPEYVDIEDLYRNYGAEILEEIAQKLTVSHINEVKLIQREAL